MKTKILTSIPALALCLLFSGCLSDISEDNFTSGGGKMNISMTLPQNITADDLSGFKVTVRNRASGVTFKFTTDVNGKVYSEVEYGNYDITISNRTYEGGSGGTLMIWNGAAQGIKVNGTAPHPDVAVSMTVSAQSTLIFKEVYFHKTKDGTGTNYGYDQYFTIYNNSDEVQYLDGIGVGVHIEYNSLASPKFTKFWITGSSELRDSIPINAFGFIFPGKGTEHPLAPGEERYIALSAIDHSGSGSVDLSDPDTVWALYHTRFTGHKVPAEGVRRLECFCDYALGTAYTISQTSPAFVLYRINAEGGANAYTASAPVSGVDFGNVIYSPPNKTGNPVIMIPKEWIFDGVEFISNSAHNPRLRPEVSLSPLLITSAAFSGISYVRKIDEETTAEAGRTVYQDNNDSAKDWILSEQPLLLNK